MSALSTTLTLIQLALAAIVIFGVASMCRRATRNWLEHRKAFELKGNMMVAIEQAKLAASKAQQPQQAA